MYLLTLLGILVTFSWRKAEAERLYEQSIKQYQNRQFNLALQSSEQALKIYREIHDRQGESVALVVLGVTYNRQGNYSQAIEYYQQSLAAEKTLFELNRACCKNQNP